MGGDTESDCDPDAYNRVPAALSGSHNKAPALPGDTYCKFRRSLSEFALIA
jgi:hypothetical protein